MIANVPENLLIELLEALRPCVAAYEMNGPAFYMLAQEVAAHDTPPEEMTLGDLACCYERACKRYNAMFTGLEEMGVR